MAISICTCCTSLVLRVMSDGVPNRLISLWERLSHLAEEGAADVAAEAHGRLRRVVGRR